MIWPPKARLDMQRKYSLFVQGFKKALTDEDKAEQDARLAAEAQIDVAVEFEADRQAFDESVNPHAEEEESAADGIREGVVLVE